MTFNCPPGSVLIGEWFVRRVENGEWEPNPREVNCIGET